MKMKSHLNSRQNEENNLKESEAKVVGALRRNCDDEER
jgi:hypothetical protein